MFSPSEVDGFGITLRPDLHEQVRRLELRSAAVGAADARNCSLPWNCHSKPVQPTAAGLPNGKPRAKFKLHLVRFCFFIKYKKNF